MNAWGRTDIGLLRQENQDTYATESVSGYCVGVVCDGMGGASGGSVASSLAAQVFLQTLRERLQENMDDEALKNAISGAVGQANRAVHDRSREEESLHGMGTTLVCAVIGAERTVVGNVGDSRAYLLRGETITQITRDHSVVENLIEKGDITREEARTHPNRNIITRALGPELYVPCDCYTVDLAEKDRLLLCSDGLVSVLTDETILSEIRSAENEDAALSTLIARTLRGGAPDNVTAVLMRKE